MRIIHTSDLHIGAPFSSKLSPEKIRIRKAELLDNFRRLCDEAQMIKADAVIIAGDLFDSENVSLSVCRQIISCMESAMPVSFIYLPGNHEKNAFTECGLNMPENLKIFTRDKLFYDLGEVTVYGICEIGQGALDGFSPDACRRNILVLHGALSEGRSTADGEIGTEDLKNKGLDYVALGHYHSYCARKIDKRCNAVYSGTPEGRGYDETGEKGYVVIDVDSAGVSHTFKAFARRTVRIAEVYTEEITGRSELDARAAAELSGIPRGDLVRLVFKGKRSPELVIDTAAFMARWSESFFHFEAKDETAVKINPKDYAADKSLKGEFIRLVSARDDLTEEEKGQIISCGINALIKEFYEV